MTETLGNILIHVALVISVYAVVASFMGGRMNRKDLVLSARNAVWSVFGLVAICAGLIIHAFLTGKYYLKYIYQYSNSTTPAFYKVAALWGGQEGSLLFWLLILMTYSSIVMWVSRKLTLELFPYVISTLMTIATFFLLLLVFEANPFQTLAFFPQDGRGLNPLLQNYYMVIHPPSLYLGYVGMSVPFAYAMAALITGRLDNVWILQIRRWTLAAWFFLSMGNLLGASWAYEVLGWGGYWGWDPVENAAFMPWLSATAFLHSVIIQEKRGILRTWNMVLVVLSFMFTLMGTFLTRSGIVSSVHSFAQSNIGHYFLTFLAFWLVTSATLILVRLKDLRSKNSLDSFLSRESAFLFNNLVLVGGAFAVLWGTLFPVLSEWVRGTKITVGPPFFNSVMIPIGLILLLLTGVGPMVAWRKTTPEQLRRNFIFPVTVTIVSTILISLFWTHDFWAIVSLSLCAFVLATIILEYQRGISVRVRTLKESFTTALIRLIANNKRRYGGYVVHIGVVLLFLGFTGSAFKVEEDFQIKVGESKKVGKYELKYFGLTSNQDAHKDQVYAAFSVAKNGKPYTNLRPSRVFFQSRVEGEPTQPYTQVDIHRTLKEDLYTALLSFDSENQTAFVKVVVNPLVQFIWIGGLFLILGTLIVMSPASRGANFAAVAKAAAFLLVLSPLLFTAPSAYAATPTVDSISKKLKCQCGCNFPDLYSCTCEEWAIPAKEEIKKRLAKGESEATILKYFVDRDGEIVLTEPVAKGFNKAAWIIPIVAMVAGLSLVVFVVKKWSPAKPQEVETPTTAQNTVDPKYLEKLEKEMYES